VPEGTALKQMAQLISAAPANAHRAPALERRFKGSNSRCTLPPVCVSYNDALKRADRGSLAISFEDWGRQSVSSVILLSVITCPACGNQREETMPTDACQYFYECTGCKTLLRPKAGDCCVFCSYGTIACPPIQEQRGCCH
jgi:hypothetical protein